MGDGVIGVTLNPGEATARALILDEPISLWGGCSPETGMIIDPRHPQYGESTAQRVLVMRRGRGSSSSSSVLAEQIRRGVGPAAIVLAEADTILALGAIVASSLYETNTPVVVIEPEGYEMLNPDDVVRVAGDAGGAATVEVSGR